MRVNTQKVPESQVQSSLEVPFSLKLFFFSLRKHYKNDNIANFVYYGKTRFEMCIMGKLYLRNCISRKFGDTTGSSLRG